MWHQAANKLHVQRGLGRNLCTVLAGFNEFGFNESSRFNESIFDLKIFLLHKNFGFNEYPG